MHGYVFDTNVSSGDLIPPLSEFNFYSITNGDFPMKEVSGVTFLEQSELI